MQPPAGPDPQLIDARAELAAASARLRRLKRLVVKPAAAPARLDAWRALSAAFQTLGESLAAWGGAREGGGDGAARERRRLEEEGDRLEAELEELDRQQRALDDRRARAIQGLDGVAHGWKLLSREGGAAAPRRADGERALLSALSQLQRCLAACERAFDEERASGREAAEAARGWRWVREVAFPAFERRLAPVDETLLLPTLRRLVEAVDRRWPAEAEGAAPSEPAEDGLEPAADERTSAPSGKPAAADDVERVMGVWASHMEALDAALEKSLAEKVRLAEKLE